MRGARWGRKSTLGIRSAMGRGVLRLGGWSFEGSVPRLRRYVLIAAPHTSNWDFVLMMAMAFALDIPISWFGKSSLFHSPLGWLFRALGGISADRDRSTNLVEQSVARFAADQDLVLVVPAEATRAAGTQWRSGFYHIARLANVPIVLGYLDYARKKGGLGLAVRPSGDVRADMDRIREFYADKRGRYPELFTTPRLREEDDDQSR